MSFTAIADKSALQIEASRGSVICWDGRLWHLRVSNKSDKSRAALLACFQVLFSAELAAEEQLANYFHNLEKHFSWHEALLLRTFERTKEGAVSDESLATLLAARGTDFLGGDLALLLSSIALRLLTFLFE